MILSGFLIDGTLDIAAPMRDLLVLDLTLLQAMQLLMNMAESLVVLLVQFHLNRCLAWLVSKNTSSQIARDFVHYSLSGPAQDIFVKHGLTQVSQREYKL